MQCNQYLHNLFQLIQQDLILLQCKPISQEIKLCKDALVLNICEGINLKFALPISKISKKKYCTWGHMNCNAWKQVQVLGNQSRTEANRNDNYVPASSNYYKLGKANKNVL